MSWAQALISGLSALAGGFIGGCIVAYRMGRWRQKVEDRLKVNEDRLGRGDRHVGQVPILETRLNTVIDEIRLLRQEVREDRQRFVSHEECDRRHGDGA